MLDIFNTTLHKFPLSEKTLKEILHDVLGSSFSLSIVIVGEKKARTLNQEYRGKDYVPNVLSFPIDETMGEIFLNLKTAQLEAPKFNLKVTDYLYYLLIHSMLHLKGYDHGDKMSLEEKNLMKKFFNIEIDF